MKRQVIREHDDDCYIIEIPEDNEIQCGCGKILLRVNAHECEVCSNLFCRGCGTKDYKGTGWFVCNNCQLDPDLIINALIEQL